MITLALILAAAAAAARDVLPSPGPFVPPLFYVHLPKNGSVLAATLLLFECPPDIFNYSIPYDALYEPDAFFAQPGNADCQPLFERMLSGHHGVPRALDPWASS